jgi:hypothetical protein
MTQYSAEIEDAYESLKEAGTVMTISRAITTPDYSTGGVTTTTETYDSYGIWDYKTSSMFGFGYIDGTMISTKDKFAIVAAKVITINPRSPDELIVDGKKYEIANAKALEPDGTPIMFFLHVRG